MIYSYINMYFKSKFHKYLSSSVIILIICLSILYLLVGEYFTSFLYIASLFALFTTAAFINLFIDYKECDVKWPSGEQIIRIFNIAMLNGEALDGKYKFVYKELDILFKKSDVKIVNTDVFITNIHPIGNTEIEIKSDFINLKTTYSNPNNLEYPPWKEFMDKYSLSGNELKRLVYFYIKYNNI